MRHEYTAQNRYIAAYPLTCGHSCHASNYCGTTRSGQRMNDTTVLHHSSKGEAPFSGKNIQVGHEYTAQNRSIAAYPLTCGQCTNEKKRKFEKPGQVGHKFPAQNRFTVANPLTCGHVRYASNYWATTRSGSQGTLRARDWAREAAARGRGPVDRAKMYRRRGPDAGTR